MVSTFSIKEYWKDISDDIGATKNHIEEDPFYINLFTLYTLKKFTKVGHIIPIVFTSVM